MARARNGCPHLAHSHLLWRERLARAAPLAPLAAAAAAALAPALAARLLLALVPRAGGLPAVAALVTLLLLAAASAAASAAVLGAVPPASHNACMHASGERTRGAATCGLLAPTRHLDGELGLTCAAGPGPGPGRSRRRRRCRRSCGAGGTGRRPAAAAAGPGPGPGPAGHSRRHRRRRHSAGSRPAAGRCCGAAGSRRRRRHRSRRHRQRHGPRTRCGAKRRPRRHAFGLVKARRAPRRAGMARHRPVGGGRAVHVLERVKAVAASGACVGGAAAPVLRGPRVHSRAQHTDPPEEGPRIGCAGRAPGAGRVQAGEELQCSELGHESRAWPWSTRATLRLAAPEHQNASHQAQCVLRSPAAVRVVPSCSFPRPKASLRAPRPSRRPGGARRPCRSSCLRRWPACTSDCRPHAAGSTREPPA